MIGDRQENGVCGGGGGLCHLNVNENDKMKILRRIIT